MIYTDAYGFLVDHSFDGGDSSMRYGMSLFFKKEYMNLYTLKTGEFVRHPFQIPWNNEKNFTVDQLLPLVLKLQTTEQGRKAIRKNLFNRIKSFFRGQNTERDRVGSTKYLKPHWFYKDSKPDTTTVFDKNELDDGYEIEYKKLDGADIVQPHHLWHLIKASRTYYLYPVGLIGIPYYILALIVHSFNKNKYEENQQIAMAVVNGKWAEKLYLMLNKSWKETSRKYWTDRNEIEYHDAIVEYFNV